MMKTARKIEEPSIHPFLKPSLMIPMIKETKAARRSNYNILSSKHPFINSQIEVVLGGLRAFEPKAALLFSTSSSRIPFYFVY